MHQSINKKKIYFYIIIFLFISTIFNFNLVSNFKEFGLIDNVNIKGLDRKEQIIVKDEIKTILNKNNFFLNKNFVLQKLDKFNFLESIIVKKILPSEINIYVKKTKFIGVSIINGEKYYIGRNGKLTNSKQVNKEKNLPFVFGKFQINDFLELQDILKKLKINSKEFSKYFYYRNKRWDLQKEDGLLVMLPSKNPNNALTIYKKLIESGKLSKIKIVDLRISNQITLTNEKK